MNTNTEVWEYAYDPFGRRLSKERKDKLAWVSTEPKRTHFVWDGSRLLQEYNYKGSYTYFYTDQDSYEPLAQIFFNNKDEKQYLAYFHTDQIGIPREMTDPFGNLLWYGEYTAWGSLSSETRVYSLVHQPFRLQNQYFDNETGLHYNYFRYYEPDTGRFINQDPIGLVGGENFYNFAVNATGWIDPWGLKKLNCNSRKKQPKFKKRRSLSANDTGLKNHAQRHSSLSPSQYLERGIKNITDGKMLKGTRGNYHIRKIGNDSYSITITDKMNQILSIDTWSSGGTKISKEIIIKGLGKSGVTASKGFF